MTSEGKYLIDPMTAFYAAVTTVENGSVGEVELMFTNETEEIAMSFSIIVRKEPQYDMIVIPNNSGE